MKIFEFHFNPKGKEDLIFDSFCYEPENIYERRLGSLFLIGEIKNTLPQNLKFLDRFASFFKKEYYAASLKSTPESALKLGLKKTNEFLENIAKSGDVSWLGNLNLAILSIKNFELNLAKTGYVKILLLRRGQITDVGKNLELEEIEPYPLKIFGKIASGKLAEGDVVLVLSKDVFNFFSTSPKSNQEKFKKTGQTLLKQIAEIQPFDEKKLRMIFKAKEKELLQISGICLVLFLIKEAWSETSRQKSFTFQQKPEKFSLKSALSPALNLLKKTRLSFSSALSRLKIVTPKFKTAKPKNIDVVPVEKRPLIKRMSLPKITFHFKKPEIKIPSIKNLSSLLQFPALFKRNVFLFSCLILFLVVGFFIFQKQERDKLKQFQAVLDSVQKDVLQAENYLALNNDKKAYEIYKTALQEVIPITKEKSSMQDEAVTLQNSIQESLEKISKLEKIQDPKLLFEFDEKEFIPQEMVFSGNNLYFFSLLAKNVYQVNLLGQKDILTTEQTFNDAAAFDSQILFFQKPNLIFFLKAGSWSGPISLSLAYADFNLKTLAVYRSSLYLLDDKAGEIIKYAAPLSQNKDLPQTWLAKNAPKITNAKAIAIDGPVWILNQDNSISQYYTGSLKKKLILDFFPEPENLYSLTATYGLFYILEPSQKRVIVLTETGEVVKQWQSDKFDNLKELAVSYDGRTIWVLNGTKIFEVSF